MQRLNLASAEHEEILGRFGHRIRKSVVRGEVEQRWLCASPGFELKNAVLAAIGRG
jgi:hypothetical protein